MDEARRMELAEFQRSLGYEFKDIELLNTALTHASYVKGDGKAQRYNERLEFLGDAVLELCVSEHLYRSTPEMEEGAMTRIRAMAVCEPALHRVAKRMGLGNMLLLSHGEGRSGGREKPSILADAVEAVIGAVFLDGGAEAAATFTLRHIFSELEDAVCGLNKRDYKTLLQEYVQKRHMGVLEYELLHSTGPDHKKLFTIQVRLGPEVLGSGQGGSKQEAGQQAAHSALVKLGQLGRQAD